MKSYSLEDQLRMSVHAVQARKREDIETWLDVTPMPPKRLKRKKMSEQAIVVGGKQQALARVTDDQGVSVDVVVARVEKVREVQRRIMKLNTHYGKVPGTEKDCLLKPGAEILGLTFQLDPEFSNVERWDGEHMESVVTCTLYHAPTGNRLGSGIGSCSTREKKYAWRNGGRKCPNCSKEGTLLKSKDKPEWFCWRKKDGCGATFPEKDERITSQKVGRVPNPDLADNYNTVRKMACKRAHVAAILFVTCASEIFTQDVEDSDEHDITPHAATDEDSRAPAIENQVFNDLMTVLRGIDAVAFDPGCTWEEMNSKRGLLGRKGSPTPFSKRLSELYLSNEIAPSQKKELSALWNRVDRKLTALEGKLKPPPVEASFTDPEDDTDAFGP